MRPALIARPICPGVTLHDRQQPPAACQALVNLAVSCGCIIIQAQDLQSHNTCSGGRQQQIELCELAVDAVRALNFQAGALHVELKYTSSNGPQLIEVGQR